MWDEYSNNNILENLIPCNCKDKPGPLSQLKNDERKCVFIDKREIKYHKNEIILKQDTTITHVACIKEGFVKQYVEGENGKNITFKILTKGDIIGFTEIMSDEPIAFNIAAITEVVTCLIPVKNVLETMSSNAKLSMDIIKYINKNNHDVFNYIINLNQRSMAQRVAGLMIYFSEIFNSTTIELPISRQELADMCSMTKESFIRTLKQFKDNEIISLDHNTLEIINLEKLSLIKSSYK